MKIALNIPHKKDCSALGWVEKGSWDTPWGTMKGLFERLPNGKRGRSPEFYYLCIECNDRLCPGKIYIDSNDLFDELGLGEQL